MSHPILKQVYATQKTTHREVSPIAIKLKDLMKGSYLISPLWHQHLRFKNGLPDVNSMLVLADVVYWHRPIEIYDEQTGKRIGYRYKFKHDLLQRNYQDYMSLWGLTKDQATTAFNRLEAHGILKRHFGPLKIGGGTLPNKMFIDLNFERVEQLFKESMDLSEEWVFPEVNLRTYSETTIENISPLLTTYEPSQESGSLSQEYAEVYSKQTHVGLQTETTSGCNRRSPPIETRGDYGLEQDTITEITTEITTKTSPLTRVREEVANPMLEIWNKTFGQNLLMTASRGVKLEQGLNQYFAGDIGAWQQFCKRVRASSFLQGQGPRGWRASLDWCLEESNLVKILEGNYQDKSSEMPQVLAAHESVSKAQDHIETLGAEDRAFAQEVCHRLGPNTYSSWFEGMRMASRTQDRVVLTFPTKFIRNTVDVRYLSALREIIQKLYPGCWLDLAVEGDTLAFNAAAMAMSEKAEPETAVSQQVKPVLVSKEMPSASGPILHRPMLAVVKDLAKSLVSLDDRPLKTSATEPEEISSIDTLASVSVVAVENLIDQKDSEVASTCEDVLPQTTDIDEREQETDERLDPRETSWGAEKESSVDALFKPSDLSVYRLRKLEEGHKTFSCNSAVLMAKNLCDEDILSGIEISKDCLIKKTQERVSFPLKLERICA